jgi:phosphate/sulfate permease
MSLKIYNNNNYVVIIVAFSMIISRTLSSHMSASVEAESSTHHSRLPSSIGAAAVKAIHIFS